METKILVDLGLTEDEATIYNSLLEYGQMPARTVALRSNIGRQLTYKILDDLIKKGIVEKKETGTKILLFVPVHPRELEKLFAKKKEEIENTKKALDESLGGMISKYNLFIGKPNVQFFEGIDGIQKIYDGLNFEKKDILLIQSPFDADLPEIDSIVQKQIKKQIANNIHTRAITPLINTTEDWVKNKDAENLVTRHITEKGMFDIPAQILIYGNKVGISSMKNPIVTTIIEDQNISDTFKIMFEYIWKSSEAQSEKIIRSFDLPNNSQKV